MAPLQYPWDSDPVPAHPPAPSTPPALPDTASGPKRRGRRPLVQTAGAGEGASPGWRYHHLTVSGPAGPLADFAEAARGAGVTPWQLDLATLEEDIFLRAAAQPAATRNLTIAGCRILARQFRERVELRHAKAVAQIGTSRACPFDLHALLPVPERILHLGPAHPEALTWLAAHWGVTDQPRQVAVRDKPATGRRLPAGHAVVGYGFFAANETPHAAVDRLAASWPALRFVLQPRP
jgi:hypothetical protein